MYGTTFQRQIPAPSYNPKLSIGNARSPTKHACRSLAPLPKPFFLKILLRIVTYSAINKFCFCKMCYLISCLIRLSPHSCFGLGHWDRHQPNSAAMNATSYGTKQEAVWKGRQCFLFVFIKLTNTIGKHWQTSRYPGTEELLELQTCPFFFFNKSG